MEELVFFILNLIAEALGLKKKRTALPPVQTAPPGPAMPVRPPLASALPPRTIARPAGDDQSVVPRQATTADFDAQLSQLARDEASAYVIRGSNPLPYAARASRPAASVPRTARATPLASLFSSSDDLVRAFVMQEILQPPRSLRPKPPQPLAPQPSAQSPEQPLL